MKCQNLFSGKNKINIINLSSELAQRVVKVKKAKMITSVTGGVLLLPMEKCQYFS